MKQLLFFCLLSVPLYVSAQGHWQKSRVLPQSDSVQNYVMINDDVPRLRFCYIPGFDFPKKKGDSLAFNFYGRGGNNQWQYADVYNGGFYFFTDFKDVHHFTVDLYRKYAFVQRQYTIERDGDVQWIQKDWVNNTQHLFKEDPMQFIKADTITATDPVTGEHDSLIVRRVHLVKLN